MNDKRPQFRVDWKCRRCGTGLWTSMRVEAVPDRSTVKWSQQKCLGCQENNIVEVPQGADPATFQTRLVAPNPIPVDLLGEGTRDTAGRIKAPARGPGPSQGNLLSDFSLSSVLLLVGAALLVFAMLSSKPARRGGSYYPKSAKATAVVGAALVVGGLLLRRETT